MHFHSGRVLSLQSVQDSQWSIGKTEKHSRTQLCQVGAVLLSSSQKAYGQKNVINAKLGNENHARAWAKTKTSFLMFLHKVVDITELTANHV